MNSLLFYFLQVFIASGILYGYYHIFLRNKKFHQYNRFYLLAIPLLSLIVPILKIPVYFNSQQEIPAVYQWLSPVQISNTSTGSSPAHFLSLEKLALYIYSFFILIFLIRIIISLVKIWRLVKKYNSIKIFSISFITTSEKGTPYSFLKWLFWNEKINLDTPKGQHVFRHELYHIQQKHSWDNLCLEILTAVCWINPFFHLVKKEIKAIHEFLADRFAAGESEKLDYAELLLMQVLQTRQQLVNPFFHNQIKRRIAMITNSSTTSYQHLRKMMVLPIIAIVIMVFAINCKSKDTENKKIAGKENNTVSQSVSDSAKTGTSPSSDELEKKVDFLKDKINNLEENKIYDRVETEAEFPGGNEAWRQFLQRNLNSNVAVDNGAPAGTYTVVAQFVVGLHGEVSDTRALTHHGYGMEDEVLRVILKGPHWKPATVKGKIVKAYRKQPVTFVIDKR